MSTHDEESVRPDLTGTTCSASLCFAVADTVGTAVMELPVEVGAVGDVVLEVPLCTEHAHLLRMGVDACLFKSGLD